MEKKNLPEKIFNFFLVKIFPIIFILILSGNFSFAENLKLKNFLQKREQFSFAPNSEIPAECQKIMQQQKLTKSEIAKVENFWRENCGDKICFCVGPMGAPDKKMRVGVEETVQSIREMRVLDIWKK